MPHIFRTLIIYRVPAVVLLMGVMLLAISAGLAVAAQDRDTVKALNGISFAEMKGYEDWKDVAVSQTDDSVKAIVGNDAMIKAYRSGIPGNGHAFPDGVKIVKIEWAKVPNGQSPYPVNVPGALKTVSLIEKDSKRFPGTSGWGYAQFVYDAKSATFSAYGKDANFAKDVCYSCHTGVKAKDYIFTAYPMR